MITVSPLQAVTPPLPSGDCCRGLQRQPGGYRWSDAIHWSITSGQLPSGLKLNPGNGHHLRHTNSGHNSTDAQFRGTSGRRQFDEIDAAIPEHCNQPRNRDYQFAVQRRLQLSVPWVRFGRQRGDGGQLHANGNGTIIAGSWTAIVRAARWESSPAPSFTGTYSVGSDGRGTMQWITTNSKGATSTTNYLLAEDSGGNFHMIENDPIGTPQTHGSGIIKPVVGGALSAASFQRKLCVRARRAGQPRKIGSDRGRRARRRPFPAYSGNVRRQRRGNLQFSGTSLPATFSLGSSNNKGILF